MRSDIADRRPALQIGYHHFALFRGSLDGLSVETLGDRYLETGTDTRHAARTLKWVRDELLRAAKRYAQATGLTGSSFARLLRTRIDPPSPEEHIALADVPSLDDFQAEFDPSGFYSEAELIQEFEKRYAGGDGPSARALRKAEQNDRLRKRLRRAIDTLENWLATTPNPTDPITIWIEPTVARPLSAVGIITIDDLVGLINRKGNLWHRRIPKFGAMRARRIIRWLQTNKVLPIEDRALLPYRQVANLLPSLRAKESAIVPLEHLQLPLGLDGSLGTNRGHSSLIRANNDLQAIEAWLDLKGESKHTRRAYTIQAERFLLWLTMEKGRPLADAGPEDCAEYLRFLEALATPGAEWPWRTMRPQWIGPKAPRWSSDWRPFTGRMTAASKKLAVTILKGLFAWLSVPHNPCRWLPISM